MNTGIGDKVGLELSDIDIQGTVESQGSSERGDDLTDKSVQVGVSGSLNVELSSADVIHGFVVEHNSDISVLKERVS